MQKREVVLRLALPLGGVGVQVDRHDYALLDPVA